jgi:hypothetical protein
MYQTSVFEQLFGGQPCCLAKMRRKQISLEELNLKGTSAN